MSNGLQAIQRLQSNQPYSSSIETAGSFLNSGQFTYSIPMGTVYTPRRFSSTPKNPLIEQYFRRGSQERLEFARKTALKIKSIEAVFLVLEWSVRGDAEDAYDGAVDLLSECENVLIGALHYLYLEYPRTGANQLELDTKLDVLINGLARADRLSVESRLQAIMALMSSKSRIVKAAIIDAIAMLENKRNKKLVRKLLNWFASDKEIDAYIRQCATSALNDLA